MLLIFAVQVRPGIDSEQFRVSLEIADPVVDPAVAGDPTFKTSVDYVSDEAEPSSPVGSKVRFCGHIAPNHDVVARWLGLLLCHPEPEGRLECDQGVVCNYVRISEPVES